MTDPASKSGAEGPRDKPTGVVRDDPDEVREVSADEADTAERETAKRETAAARARAEEQVRELREEAHRRP